MWKKFFVNHVYPNELNGRIDQNRKIGFKNFIYFQAFAYFNGFAGSLYFAFMKKGFRNTFVGVGLASYIVFSLMYWEDIQIMSII